MVPAFMIKIDMNNHTLGFSVFCGQPIPYPKREFINDDDNDAKSNKVSPVLFTNAPNLTLPNLN